MNYSDLPWNKSKQFTRFGNNPMSYYWKAVYNDKTELSQFNADGSENKYTDIDRGKLIRFDLWCNTHPVLIIHLDGYKRLICRRRVAQKLFSGEKTVVWLVGWQQTKKGVNSQMICAVFEDGHIEVIDRFIEGHGWFYPIIFMKEERDENEENKN